MVVELGALIATLGLKRGLALALAERPDGRDEACTVWDALLLALIVALALGGLLFAVPQIMYPDGVTDGFDRWFAWTIVPIALSDVALAALAYRRNIKASVTARAIIEPWTISVAVLVYYYIARDDGLTLAYMTALVAAMVASLDPDDAQLWPAARLAAASRPSRGDGAAQRAARGRRDDRMGHAQRRPLHPGDDVRAQDRRHLLHGAADQSRSRRN